MEEIKEVTFKTITPLWTGDAWGENNEIRPSSIMGSLRFWFGVYCKTFNIATEKLNKKGVPADNIEDYIKNYNKENNKKENFESLLGKELENDDYDLAINNVLEKIKLPLISRIFGCTGWKSQIEIKEIEFNNFELNKFDIDFGALYEKLRDSLRTQNSEFWSNKLLFNDKDKIILFDNVKASIIVSNAFLNEFKRFLKFYENKIILCGGKKSFGFGFCRLETNLPLDDVIIEEEKTKIFDFKEINIDEKKDKIVLGFNFKHYQRLSERKRFREKYFGKQSEASKFFFSTQLSNKSKIYLIAFKEHNNDNSFNSLIERYSKFGENENV